MKFGLMGCVRPTAQSSCLEFESSVIKSSSHSVETVAKGVLGSSCADMVDCPGAGRGRRAVRAARARGEQIVSDCHV